VNVKIKEHHACTALPNDNADANVTENAPFNAFIPPHTIFCFH
jgi:hypothetical protein